MMDKQPKMRDSREALRGGGGIPIAESGWAGWLKLPLRTKLQMVFWAMRLRSSKVFKRGRIQYDYQSGLDRQRAKVDQPKVPLEVINRERHPDTHRVFSNLEIACKMMEEDCDWEAARKMLEAATR